MGTLVDFRLLVLDSLKYNSKAESPIDRSAEAVISKNLTVSRHNHLISYLIIYLFVLFVCFLFFVLFCFGVFFVLLFYFIFHIF